MVFFHFLFWVIIYLSYNCNVIFFKVWFSDTCEDILSALGAPSRVFFKAEDKMRIHSPHAHKRDKARRSDFFYNYFTLGLVSFLHYKIFYNLLLEFADSIAFFCFRMFCLMPRPNA